MSSLKFFFHIIYGIYCNKSLCRILQNIECKKNKISGNIIEFGTEPLSKNSFVSLAKKIRVKKIDFSDKYIKKVGVINADLNKKTSLKKNKYNNVLLFNVLEHLTDINNAKKEIKKILKNKGILIGFDNTGKELKDNGENYYEGSDKIIKIIPWRLKNITPEESLKNVIKEITNFLEED